MMQNVSSKLYAPHTIIYTGNKNATLASKVVGLSSGFTCFCILHCIWYVCIVTSTIKRTFITESVPKEEKGVNVRARRGCDFVAKTMASGRGYAFNSRHWQ